MFPYEKSSVAKEQRYARIDRVKMHADSVKVYQSIARVLHAKSSGVQT